jgi:rubrerythrin
VPVIKAASLVEYNSGDYRTYLKRVFSADPKVCKAIDGWAEEEAQHGLALARWARMADQSFDFEASFKRFTDGFRVPVEATASIRGSRSGELIARCMIETGTNSFYTALADAADEPVLAAICRRIADDEAAHYQLFYHHLTRHLATERLGFWRRMAIAWGRIAESEDDELAYAYYAANGNGAAYDRKTCTAAFGSRALDFYTPGIIRRGVAMVFKAVGLAPGGVRGWIACHLAWWMLCAERLRCRARVRLGG